MCIRDSFTTFIASVLYYVYTLHFSLALDKSGINDPKEVVSITAVASLMLPLGAVMFKVLGTKSNKIQFGLMFTLIGIGLIGVGLSTTLGMAKISAIVQQTGCGIAIPVPVAYTHLLMGICQKQIVSTTTLNLLPKVMNLD